MKLAIVGSRDFTDYELFKNEMKKYLDEVTITEIVSGGATGTDSLAERLANEYSIDFVVYYPEWSVYGKGAGPVRNKKIVNRCDKMIAFPSKIGKGTQNAIQQCIQAGKTVDVIKLKCNGY
jgi:hypothetical protein